ncbi:MAG: segregation and condensation protein B [Alteromonadaceae bacterium]|jgi:segregation and condensation protein B
MKVEPNAEPKSGLKTYKKAIDDEKLKCLIEAAIFVHSGPLSIKEMKQTIFVNYHVTNKRIVAQLNTLDEEYKNRGIELVKVASGYRFQAASLLNEDLSHLFKEKAPRYSGAMLETLSLVAYKQPITRGAIEDIRGVAVSSHIIKTLIERNWIKIVGHKEVPGRPALYATTNDFLDYFSLKSLKDLPKPLEIEKKTIVAPL